MNPTTALIACVIRIVFSVCKLGDGIAKANVLCSRKITAVNMDISLRMGVSLYQQ